MNGTDLPSRLWFKSSYSNDSGECVEVARLTGGVATRDSKDPAGPALRFDGDAWASFVQAVADGEFPQL